MTSGFVLIHRRLFGSEDRYWNEDRPRTRWEAWVDLIQMAAHSDHEVFFDGGVIRVARGQVPTSERRLAERWRWTRKRVRTFLRQLETGSRLVRKRSREGAHGLSVLTLCNYEAYQSPGSREGPTEGPTKGPRRAQTERREKEGRTPGEELEALRERYSESQLTVLDQTFEAIRSTRKTGKVADSILLREMRYWAGFEPEEVVQACHTYLEKGYAGAGKREEYLRGILRGVVKERGQSTPSSPHPYQRLRP